MKTILVLTGVTRPEDMDGFPISPAGLPQSWRRLNRNPPVFACPSRAYNRLRRWMNGSCGLLGFTASEFSDCPEVAMETIRQPRFTWPIAICLAAGLMVAMVFGTSLLVWQPWTGHLLSAAPASPSAPLPGAKPSAEAVEDSRYVAARKRMVEEDLRGRDITNAKVLEVMGSVPRHRFVAKDLLDVAYADQPLPIGHDQTISQPYIVALMTQAARPRPTSRALDIGTGSGYQAAVLAELCEGGVQHRDPQAAGRRRAETD